MNEFDKALDVMPRFIFFSEYDIIVNALKQASKEHELLELYRKQLCILLPHGYSHLNKSQQERLEHYENKIKELEELK